jgi:hypothetical protein
MSNASLAFTGGSTAFCLRVLFASLSQDLTGEETVMKKEINQVVILALAAAFFLGISSARAADETPVGKVQRIYVEANRGVLIEQSLGRAPENAKRWADIDFGPHSTQSRRRVTVLLPQELNAEQGDLVEVTLAPNYAARSISPAPLTKTHRATLVSAKWFTPQADAFDRAPLAAASRLRAAGPIF